MAIIKIVTTEEEQNKILVVLREIQGQTVAVSDIAKRAGMNQNRVRYVITDLEEAKKIERIPTKAFNKHYIRYAYKVC